MSKLLKGRIRPLQKYPMSRGKDDWDSIKAFPFDNPEHNVEPKQEDFVREVYERHYYPFHNHAKYADHHGHRSMFAEYRQWQHLYQNPE
jgi:hypothetical protein